MNETDALQCCDGDLQVLQTRLVAAKDPARVLWEIKSLVEARSASARTRKWMIDLPVEGRSFSAKIHSWMSAHLKRVAPIAEGDPERFRAWLTYLFGIEGERGGLLQPILLSYSDRGTQSAIAQLQEATSSILKSLHEKDLELKTAVKTLHGEQQRYLISEIRRAQMLAGTGDGEGAAEATRHYRKIAKRLIGAQKEERSWLSESA